MDSLPRSLTDNQLLFDHALSHALFCRKRDVPESMPKWSLEELIDYHWLLQGEMTRRGYQHHDFDDLDGVGVGKSTVESIKNIAKQIKAKGLYLPAPHAEMLWKGTKTLLLKCRSYGGMLNKPLYWGDAEKIYGVLKLTDISAVSDDKADELVKKHQIDKNERTKWWPNSHQLYLYKFDILSKFKVPIQYDYQRGVQVFFTDPTWVNKQDEFTIAVNLDGALVNIDSTLSIPECFTTAEPKELAKESLDFLSKNAMITVFTTRYPRYYELTANWLQKNEIPYDQLLVGKPEADLIINNLSDFNDSWSSVVSVVRAAENLAKFDYPDSGTIIIPGRTTEGINTQYPEKVKELKEKLSQKLGKAFTIAPGGIVGAPGIGAGEIIPCDPDKTFAETTPMQYMRVKEDNIVLHTFFKISEKKRAEAWKDHMKKIASKQGKDVEVTLDSIDNNLVGSIIIRNVEATEKSDFIKKIDTVQKQLVIPDLLLLAEKFSEEDQFMTICVRHVTGLIKDPVDFCGAFWKDKDQWYHGPQKIEFVDSRLQEDDGLPPGYSKNKGKDDG